MTRPGAATRRLEVESMARVLGAYKPLVRIEPPGTLDGGDVLPGLAIPVSKIFKKVRSK